MRQVTTLRSTTTNGHWSRLLSTTNKWIMCSEWRTMTRTWSVIRKWEPECCIHPTDCRSSVAFHSTCINLFQSFPSYKTENELHGIWRRQERFSQASETNLWYSRALSIIGRPCWSSPVSTSSTTWITSASALHCPSITLTLWDYPSTATSRCRCTKLPKPTITSDTLGKTASSRFSNWTWSITTAPFL